MKKSSIITKIMLAFVMVTLIFALVACGNDSSSSGGKKKDKDKGGKKTELTLSEHLNNAAVTVDNLLEEVGKIPTAKAAYVALSLAVEYEVYNETGSQKTGEGRYALSVKGNVKEPNPSLDISFTAPKSEKNPQGVVTSTTQNFEWFRLGADASSNFYLKQPLTAVNTTKTVDTASLNLSALAGEDKAINNLMWIAIDAVSDVITKNKLGDPLLSNFLSGGDSSGGDNSLDDILNMFEGIMTVTETSNGWKISAASGVWGVIGSFAGSIPVVGGMIPGVMNSLLGETDAERPTLDITISTVTKNNKKVVSGLSVGYEFANGTRGALVLDLSLSTTEQVSITAPNYTTEYKADALHANVTATAAQKGLKAALDAFLSPNLTTDTGNYIGYAELTASDVDGENAVKSYGIVKDGLAAFDLAGAFAKLGYATTNPTNYKANIQSADETKDADGVLQSVENMTFPTVVAFFNKLAHDAKADYVANKGKAPVATDEGTINNPNKGLLVNIYAWLVGEESEAAALASLGTTVKDGVYSYNDPTEQKMMQALKDKIGDYVNFTIDVSGPVRTTYNNYLNTVKSIAELIGDNTEWIIGFKVIDSTKMKQNITSWGDFAKFEKWLYGFEANMEFSAWGTALKAQPNFPTRNETTGYGKYGIVDWNTITYRGGLVVYSASKTYAPKTAEAEMQPGDDLLDLVNVFVKIPHEFDANDKPVANSFSAITVADVAKLLNNNICKAAKYFGIEVAEDYEFDNDETNMSLTKQVVTKAIGYETINADIITTLINDGLYIEIGSAPEAGIYGFIAIYNVNEETMTKGNAEYAKLEGEINLKANTVKADAMAQEAALITETTVSLNAGAGDPNEVQTEDIMSEDEEPVKIGIKIVYPNADTCFDMLKDLWDGYVAYDNAH